jgi:hypothetical protein
MPTGETFKLYNLPLLKVRISRKTILFFSDLKDVMIFFFSVIISVAVPESNTRAHGF